MASRAGVKEDREYEAAYWRVFNQFFGPHNAAIVKAMLLAKHPTADTGDGELDRVCYGLRETMAWLAEAIEKRALAESGSPVPEAQTGTKPSRARPVSGRRTARRPGSPSSR